MDRNSHAEAYKKIKGRMKSRKYLAFLKPKKKLRFIEGKIEGMYGRLNTVKV